MRIGVFDSGVGGLTVLAECKRLLPKEKFFYLSDKKFAPYGNKNDKIIRQRVFFLAEKLFKKGIDALVVACNTATGVAIKPLREKYPDKIIVGLEPAIAPCFRAFPKGKAALLCTPLAAKQENIKRITDFLDYKSLEVVPLDNLASLIDKNIKNLNILTPYIKNLLTPFLNYDAFILGCTHFVFIRPIIEDFFRQNNRPISIFDGNLGAANRLKYFCNIL